MSEHANVHLRPSELFLLFTRMSLLGFGGVLPWAYRILVDRRKVLSKSDFTELLGLAQLLPGPTICNLAVIVGHRHAGLLGGLAALAGMIIAPMGIALMLAAAYQNTQGIPLVGRALTGMSAVAAGLVVAVALRMSSSLGKNGFNLLFAASTFFAVGLMRWPLLVVVAVLLPLALLIQLVAIHGQR